MDSAAFFVFVVAAGLTESVHANSHCKQDRVVGWVKFAGLGLALRVMFAFGIRFESPEHCRECRPTIAAGLVRSFYLLGPAWWVVANKGLGVLV